MGKRSIRFAILLAALAASSLAVAAGAGAAHRRTVNVVTTASNSTLGKTILVTTGGRSLYRRKGETPRHWLCTGSCTSLWPPLLVPSKATDAKLGKVRGLGKARRPDGKLQVTYNGHPLYRFANDHAAGDAKGQGFLGIWFAIPHAAASTTTTTTAPPPPPPSPYGY